MNKLKSALYRFMYGRYGGDQLNTFILVLTAIVMLLNIFLFKNGIVSVVIWVMLILNIYRCYSRNIYKRRSENQKFLNLIAPFTKRKNLAKKQSQDKDHKYFICPSCKQNIRVPKGRGKITITCPSCQTKFDKRS